LAFGLRPHIVDFVLAGSLLGILTLIPFTPLKLGQSEAAGVLTLPFLLHVDKNVVFTILFLQRVVSILYIFIVGFLSVYVLKLDMKAVRKISNIKSEFNNL
jgi:uncharacterized membrane protein YbhN (UPF0104 family)